jgi:hypothetical protein
MLVPAVDVGARAAVVELPRGDVRDVAEAVPLCAALGVERVEVVVGEAGGQGFDRVVERLAAEAGDFGDVQGEAGQGLVKRVLRREV